MFVFNRSAVAVLIPLALLLAVVLWSGRSAAPVNEAHAVDAAPAVTVAQADAPRRQGG
jgi:hypothetical protein